MTLGPAAEAAIEKVRVAVRAALDPLGPEDYQAALLELWVTIECLLALSVVNVEESERGDPRENRSSPPVNGSGS